METVRLLKMLKWLFEEGKINKQQLKTYRGQVLSGNGNAALVGLMRKKLIE